MKNVKFLFVLFLATATLISCSKDDDDKITTEPSLVGVWNMTNRTMDGEPDPLDACEEKMKFAFTETQLTSYSYEGEECEIEEVLVYDYTLDESKLVLTLDNSTTEYTVEKLTESTLELSTIFNDAVYVSTFTRQ